MTLVKELDFDLHTRDVAPMPSNVKSFDLVYADAAGTEHTVKIKIQLFYKRHLRKCYRYRLLTFFRIVRSPARLVVAVFNIRNRKRRCLCRRRFRRNACCIHMILILCRFDIGLLSVNFYFAKSDIAPEIIRSSIRLVHCDLNCSHNFLRVLCHCDRLL